MFWFIAAYADFCFICKPGRRGRLLPTPEDFLKWFALFEIWCACRNQRWKHRSPNWFHMAPVSFDLTARAPRRCVFFGERHCYDEMICKTLLPVLAYVTDSQNISERGRHCIGRERATQEASIAKSFDAIIMEVNLQNREIDVYPRSCSARERGKLSVRKIGGPGWRWCPNTGNPSISIFCKILGGR